MKKLFFTLLALVGTMSMNAQMIKVYDGDQLVFKHSVVNSGKVVFEEAPPTTGTEKRTGDIDVNWVQLWANGPKFAEYNVGAASATEYGGYYTWGGYNDKEEDYYNTGVSNLSCTGNFITDTATKFWGSKWRMPTSAELSDAEGGLLHECDCVWKENYNGTGKNGLLCTGKGAYSSNSVFLPAAGMYLNGVVRDPGDEGHYWSSTPSESDSGYILDFSSYKPFVMDDLRYRGYSVRAVLNETK